MCVYSEAPAKTAAFTPCRSHRLASLIMRSLVQPGHWQPLLMSSTATLFTGLPTATSATGCGFLCSSFHALGGSSIMHGARRRQMGLAARRPRGSTRLIVRCLNRIMLEPSEVVKLEDGFLTARLGAADSRTVHVRKVLKAENGECVRVGVVDAGLTDAATVSWREPREPLSEDGAAPPKAPSGIPPMVPVRKEGVRKKRGTVPQDLVLDLGRDENLLERVPREQRPKVALMLALPRPLQLERILPMVSSLGVSTLVLSTAKKVEKMYFGSHMFRDPDSMRQKLVEGLSQSGHTALPEVVVVRRLKVFLEDDLEQLFPSDRWARIVAHPNRLSCTPISQSLPSACAQVSLEGQGRGEGRGVTQENETCNGGAAWHGRVREEEGKVGVTGVAGDGSVEGPRRAGEAGLSIAAKRFAEVEPPEGCDPAEAGVLVTVGPEGGWEEPHELNLLSSFGFQAVSLGSRVLRSDVAVCALLALAHAWVDERAAGKPANAPSLPLPTPPAAQ